MSLLAWVFCAPFPTEGYRYAPGKTSESLARPEMASSTSLRERSSPQSFWRERTNQLIILEKVELDYFLKILVKIFVRNLVLALETNNKGKLSSLLEARHPWLVSKQKIL